MRDKVNGFRGLGPNAITRLDVRNARTTIELANNVQAYTVASLVEKILNAAKLGMIDKTEFVSAIETANNDLRGFQQEYYSAPKNKVTGICSYSSFSGEKTGFANNAFSSNVTDNSKPRTNKDVEATPVKSYNKKSRVARNARKRYNTTPDVPANVPATYTPVSDDTATQLKDAAIKRQERNREIENIRKLHTDKFGNLLPRPDAVEIFRAKNR